MNKKILSVLILSTLATGCATNETLIDEVETKTQDTSITLDENGYITDEVAIIAISEETYIQELDEILTEDGYEMRVEDANYADIEMATTDNTIYFSFDSTKINPKMKKTIESQLAFLKKYPKIKVILEGHTDERGSNAYNVVLGEKRAKAVKTILLNAGIKDSQIEVISYGEMKPLSTGSVESEWNKNRRAVFIYK